MLVLLLEVHIVPKLLMDVIWVSKLPNTKIVSPVNISDPNMVVSAILILPMDMIWVSILNHTAKHKDSFPCEDKWSKYGCICNTYLTYGCDMSIQTAKHKDSFPCEDKRSKHGYISGTIYDRKVYFVPN